jgi:hypothetical protein
MAATGRLQSPTGVLQARRVLRKDPERSPLKLSENLVLHLPLNVVGIIPRNQGKLPLGNTIEGISCNARNESTRYARSCASQPQFLRVSLEKGTVWFAARRCRRRRRRGARAACLVRRGRRRRRVAGRAAPPPARRAPRRHRVARQLPAAAAATHLAGCCSRRVGLDLHLAISPRFSTSRYYISVTRDPLVIWNTENMWS